MDRRNFNRLCSGLMAGASSLSLELAASESTDAGKPGSQSGALSGGADIAYPRTTLVGPGGQTLTTASLASGSSHIFSYPYKTTPCFLLRLSTANVNRKLAGVKESGAENSGEAVSGNTENDGKVLLADEAGNTYAWHGGVGPGDSIVAFSAICTHKMSHPAKPVSHLNFRPEEKIIRRRDGSQSSASELIYCCSEHSVYDPAAGAKVLSGPASQPLAAIELAVNENDEIVAVGTYGGNMFEVFLEKFGFRQAMESGVSDPYELVGAQAEATPAADYSNLQILC